MTPKANSSIMRSLMSSDAYTKNKKYQPKETKGLSGTDKSDQKYTIDGEQ